MVKNLLKVIQILEGLQQAEHLRKVNMYGLPEQKEHRATVANDLIQTATNDPDFLKKFITGDES